jgi:hypothetical protein
MSVLGQQIVIGVHPVSREETQDIQGTVVSPARAFPKGKATPQR